MVDGDNQEPVSENVTSGSSESINESTSSSSDPRLDRDQNTSNFRKETFYKEKIFSPRSILRECLQASFAHKEDARTFCFEYCKEVYQDLSDTTPFSQILNKISEYYEVYGRERDLWQWIRGRNESNYQKWFDKWENARRYQNYGAYASGSHGKAEDKDNDKENRVYSSFTGQTVKPAKSQSDTKAETTDSKSSSEIILASGDREAISVWFFSELTPRERGMILTAALFQGINRHYFADISCDIENIFFEESKVSPKDSQS